MRAGLRLVAIDAAAWVALSLAVGLVADRLPSRWFDRDTALTRPRRPRRTSRGRGGERPPAAPLVRRLPAVAGLGRHARTSRRRLVHARRLDDLAAETRRAEYVHLALAAAGPLFLLWNPPGLGAAMVAFGVGANAPFVAAQRTTRARLAARRKLRSHNSAGTGR